MNNNVIVPDEWPRHKKIKFIGITLIIIIVVLLISVN
jgi:hypothetical protein